MYTFSSFNTFSKILSNYTSKFTVKYKESSKFMKLLSKFLFFNKDFMTSFTTTIGKTVYFPSKEFISKNPAAAIMILSHEYRHIHDSKKLTRILFSLIYLFPQIFFLLFILFMFMYGLWGLFFIFLLFPLPAYGRMLLELNGYTMSLFALNEMLLNKPFAYRKYRLENAIKAFNENFTGSAYYFMWPFGVENKLMKKMELILSGDILYESTVYADVRSAFNKLK